MKGVQEQTNNECRLLKNKNINVVDNDLQKISEICQRVPKEVCTAFGKVYGPLLELLHVPLDTAVLSALTQFWNPSLRCFELPALDLVPTIEEYEKMLGLSIQEKPGVYLYRGNFVPEKRIAEMIGLPSKQATLKGKPSAKGWNKALLEDHLEYLAKQKSWDRFLKTLALLIYGLILFPFSFGMVDQAAMDVFFQYEMHRANPIPAILAETFLSLEVCSRRDEGMLRCCPQLLYVWFVTHMYASNHLGYAPDPLKNFHRIPMKRQTPREWKKELAQFEGKHFPWVCPWYHAPNIIFSCGNFPNVPLMGPRGCVVYTPAIALRQLKWTQVKPSDRTLGGLSFQYNLGGNNGPQEEVKNAWQDIKRKGEKELGKPRVTASTEYKEWKAARKVPNPTPKDIPHEDRAPQGPNPEVAFLTSQLEVLKAQMRLLEDREEQAKIEVEVLEKRYQQKDKEIESLNREWMDSYENSRHAKKPRKEDKVEIDMFELEKMQTKIQAMEEEMITIQKEKELIETNGQLREQKMEALQEDLVATHVELVEWKNSTSNHLDSLTKASQMEEVLLKKINELVGERNWLKSEVQRLERENRDLVNEPITLNEHHEKKVKEWRKKYGEMTNCVQEHATELAKHYKGAMEEIDIEQLPLKTYRLIKYCQKLVRDFM